MVSEGFFLVYVLPSIFLFTFNVKSDHTLESAFVSGKAKRDSPLYSSLNAKLLIYC